MELILFLLGAAVLVYLGVARYRRFSSSESSDASPAPEKAGGSKRVPSDLPADSESQYLLCTFGMAAKIIAADGEYTAEERERLKRFMQDELNLGAAEEKIAWRVFESAVKDELEIRDYALAFRRHFPDQVLKAERVVVTLLQLASSDGFVNSQEEQDVRTAAILLGVSPPGFELLKSQHLKNSELFH